MVSGRHLASEELAAYLDKTLSEAERARVEAHLADCDACREELVSAAKLLQHAPRSTRWFIGLSAIAAAAVLAVFVGRASIDSEPFAGEQLRGGDTPFASEGSPSVRAVAPIGRKSIGAGIGFIWRPIVPEAVYRFTLTDDRGGIIWVETTSDTTLPLPNHIVLGQGRTFHWYVDVLRPDGSSATTGIKSFQVVP
jgi:hypothetical protein